MALIAFAALQCSLIHAETGSSASLDKTAVEAIDVTIDDENLDKFGFTLPKQAITERVIKNLSEWKFPVQSTDRPAGSHTLQARIGRITHRSTPVGFSFSSGNSDPRAQDFQKADVLTISCRLISNQNQADVAERTMEFSVDSMTDSSKKVRNQTEAVDKLTDRISTACFTLLDDLHLGETGKATSGSVSRPGWMPSIRVEILENEDGAQKSPKADEKQNRGEEPRKKIIIHNQGTPVIIKLGHERL
jgi:hypothetical protein